MQTPTEYQTELRTWLVDYLHKRGMNVTDCYSVSICRSCNHRGMWGGEMRGVRAATCAGCKYQTAHDFHPFSSLRNAAPCSPSSTPETDAHIDALNEDWDVVLASVTNLARKLERERNALRAAIRMTIMENLHLADGDVCTLKRLKDAIAFNLDSPENSQLSHPPVE